MIENFHDELYQLQNKEAKGAKLYGNWRAKDVPKLFSKHLKDRICKIKQYLNNILMIINQNTFSNPKDIIKFANFFEKKI